MKTIIEMAREAGLHRTQHNLMSNPVQHRFSYDGYEENFEHFAALVRADERAHLLAGVEMPEPEVLGWDFDKGWDGVCAYGYTTDQLRETVAKAVARKDAEVERLKETASDHRNGRLAALEENAALKAEIERLKVAVVDERAALIHYFNEHWRSDWSDEQIIEAIEAREKT